MSAVPDHRDQATLLAALIRELDGNHDLGAGELAERLVERGVTLRTRADFDAAVEQRAGRLAREVEVLRHRHRRIREMLSEPVRSWRTQVHVLKVATGTATVRLPGWTSQEPITVRLADLPFVPVAGQRYHAQVNLGAERAEDLVFSSWEPARCEHGVALDGDCVRCDILNGNKRELPQPEPVFVPTSAADLYLADEPHAWIVVPDTGPPGDLGWSQVLGLDPNDFRPED